MYQLVKLLHPSLSIELSDERCLVLATCFHVVHLFSKLLNADLRESSSDELPIKGSWQGNLSKIFNNEHRCKAKVFCYHLIF